jgi:3-oxoadipate enol-lactonase
MNQVSIGDVCLTVLERGAGMPLLLVHGFPLDHRMWDGQIEELSAGLRVIAPDLRGFGGSGGAGDCTTMARFADDLARLLDALAVKEPIALCGLSMGGYVAWEFWRRHGERLSHLILCDTRSAADPPDAARLRRETADRVLSHGTGILVETMLPKLFAKRTFERDPSVVEAARRMIVEAPPAGVAAALRGMAQRHDASDWLTRISIPALVVCGQEDAISGVAEMEQIARKLPHAQFVVVPDCGHMAPMEDATRVNRAIRRFIAGDSSPDSPVDA